MTAISAFIWSLCIGAVAMTLWGGTLAWRIWRIQKAGGRLKDVVEDYAAKSVAGAHVLNTGMAQDAAVDMDNYPLQNGFVTSAWLQSGWAKALLHDEDKSLLDQAGIELARGAAIYVLSRAVLALVFSILVVVFSDVQGVKVLLVIFFGLGLGVMMPKWIVQSRASKRRKRVDDELPLFVDMLRLLQGVGLSVDQSLHILASEFCRVLPVISAELELANRLYSTGRSREHAFQRLIALSGDEDMAALVSLLAQVDKHGGAVQEPLAQFAQRLREKRQAAFKEKIGAITVKMTGVMVLTLLPALIVITAGPGFMAVMRSLSR